MATPNLPAFDLWDGYASTLDIYDPCWLYAGRNSTSAGSAPHRQGDYSNRVAPTIAFYWRRQSQR